MPPLVPLHLLALGEEGYVAEFAGCEHAIHRLEEMGLRRGARVRMLHPGTPCILLVEGHRISFRSPETEVLVAVETVGCNPAPASLPQNAPNLP